MKTFSIFLTFLLISYFNTQTFTAKVVGVLDGDTIDVLFNNEQIRIRVDGIDCPEKRQAFGTKAKQFTSDFCFGKNVIIKKKDVDRYGRTIARVIYNGKDLSEELVKEGFAWHYKKYSDDEFLSRLEIQARRSGVGLWCEDDPVAPWCFRKPKDCE